MVDITPLTTEEQKKADATDKRDPVTLIMPVPIDAPKLSKSRIVESFNKKFGVPKPTAGYPYHNEKGEILGYVLRWDIVKDGKPDKEVRSFCYCEFPNEERKWFSCGFPEPRSLYNLHELHKNPDKPILVLEGESTSEAAKVLFPNHVVTTSCGGSGAAAKTDWAPMKDRYVFISIDHDKAGQQYGDAVYKLCKEAGAKSIKLLSPAIFAHYIIEDGSVVECQRDLSAGYDLADAAQEGFTAELIKELEVMLHEKGLSLFFEYPEPDGEVNIQNPRTTSLKAVNIADFLSMIIPPREMIMAPIIPEQGLVMIYAPRGVGKTYVALTIAYVIAKSGNMFDAKWSCNKPHKVLFVDGEMPASVIQERLASIVGSLDYELIGPDNLKIISPDLQDRGMPDLSITEGQQVIEEHLDGVNVLFLDNISALCRSGRENESESWKVMQEWLLTLRRRGITVILIHHSNKTGEQRGTSKREDILDTVIKLCRPKDYTSEDGARFEVHYEKARGFYGDEAKSFEAWLNTTDGKLGWQVRELEDSPKEKILALRAEGLSQREIANAVGTSLASVNRALNKTKGA